TPHNLEQSGDEMVAMQVNESPDREFILNFKPGMSATVDILTNTVVDVVSIPIQAVTVRDFAKVNTPAQSDTTESENSEDTDSNGNTTGTNEDFRRVVFVNENGVAKRVQVETGISDNSYIQVLSGLDAGDEVVTGSYRILSRELSDGDPLKTEKNNAVADRRGS
ncbi:MAG: efflux RND transporter periplasmic adaptor subunit, partial [Balneolaceae bacterium]